MKLEQARRYVGAKVVYIPNHARPEYGVITDVGDRYVFVRYGNDQHSKATDAGALDLFHHNPCVCTMDSRTGDVVDYDCGRTQLNIPTHQ